MRLIHLCGAACIASLLPSGAIADLIFDQSVDLTVGATFSDFAPSIFSPQQIADDFKLLSGASTITDVHWWGIYCCSFTPTEPDDFVIRIFGDIGGTPGINPLFQFEVENDVGRVDTGLGVFAYSADISPLTLAADTTYWLSIVNNTVQDTDDTWGWSFDLFGNMHARFLEGAPWFDALHNVGFQLTDDALVVPEPATWALFGVGLLGLAAVHRRSRAEM